MTVKLGTSLWPSHTLMSQIGATRPWPEKASQASLQTPTKMWSWKSPPHILLFECKLDSYCLFHKPKNKRNWTYLNIQINVYIYICIYISIYIYTHVYIMYIVFLCSVLYTAVFSRFKKQRLRFDPCPYLYLSTAQIHEASSRLFWAIVIWTNLSLGLKGNNDRWCQVIQSQRFTWKKGNKYSKVTLARTFLSSTLDPENPTIPKCDSNPSPTAAGAQIFTNKQQSHRFVGIWVPVAQARPAAPVEHWGFQRAKMLTI